MKIQDLEALTGLDRATIRYYETEGMLRPNRLENGYRDYSNSDKSLLIRIKLLRQMGIPLVKIKELQQGSVGLQNVLSEQIEILHQQRDGTQRSVQLCELLLSDNISFEDLDGALYLSRLETMIIEYPRRPEPALETIPEFHEEIQLPWHPFRHLIARSMDVFLIQLILTLIWVYIFRVRVSDSWLYFLPPVFLAPLMLVPLEAVCYRIFGTTVGKCVMGIQVTQNDGRKHRLSTGIRRSFRAYRYGWGWGIPVMHLWAIADGWDNHKIGKLKWNEESEITYHSCSWKNIVTAILSVAMVVFLGFGTNNVMHLPKYAGRDISLAEFSKNYNDYALRNMKLINPMAPNGSIHIWGHMANNAHRQSDYFLDSGAVKGFSYGYNDAEFFSVDVVPEEYKIAMQSLLIARPGENEETVSAFYDRFRAVIATAMKDGTNSIDITYKNVKIHWSIYYKNCTYTESPISTGHLRAFRDGGYELQSSVNIVFRLEPLN